jgi:hypothetical protein
MSTKLEEEIPDDSDFYVKFKPVKEFQIKVGTFIIDRLFRKKKKHTHDWVLQYWTGNSIDGKSDVVKCDCGQWAVYHRNPVFGETHKYILIDQ